MEEFENMIIVRYSKSDYDIETLTGLCKNIHASTGKVILPLLNDTELYSMERAEAREMLRSMLRRLEDDEIH